MNTGLLLRLILCVGFFGLFLYGFINKQNEIVGLRIAIPQVAREVKEIEEENVHLQFLIDQFENPDHLMQLSREPEYRHLKNPILDEIATIDLEGP